MSATTPGTLGLLVGTCHLDGTPVVANAALTAAAAAVGRPPSLLHVLDGPSAERWASEGREALARGGGWEAELGLDEAVACGGARVLVSVLPAGGDLLLTAATPVEADAEPVDALTGLLNRAAFLARLERSLRWSGRRGDAVAVLFVDLDGFKAVNDRFGHAAGDAVLVEVARRLQAAIRATDVAGRLGGDEFAILCQGGPAATDLRGVAARIVDALRPLVVVEGRPLSVTASVGMAVAPAGSQQDAGALLREADAAMYRAKSGGKDRWQLFDSGLRRRLAERRELEEDLRAALEAGALKLRYRPRFELGAGALVAFEAVPAWEHRVRGVLPAKLVQRLADDAGLGDALIAWVLGEAAAQAASWRARALRASDLRVWVPVAPGQLHRPALAGELADAVASHGLEPGAVGVQVTERVASAGPDSPLVTLKALADAGVPLAFERFGGGSTALALVRQVPFAAATLDLRAVRGRQGSPRDYAVTSSLVSLAHALGLAAVGDGVEDDDQLGALAAMGCDQAQGPRLGASGWAAEADAVLSAHLDAAGAAAPAQ